MNSELEVGAAAGKVIGTIQNSNQLEPKLWNKEALQEKVQKALGLIALKFVNSWDLSIEIPIFDIILTGSTASYNWTTESDIDLHIVVDLAALHSNTEALSKFLNAKATIWNAQHNVTLFGHPVELYVQDVSEAHVSAGVYSVAHQSWVQRPTMISGADVNTDQIYQLVSKYLDSIDYLEVLYNRGEFAEVVKRSEEIRAYIKKRRAESLGEGGLNSTFNLVFKVLRKGGLLKKLGDLHIKSYDSMMSLAEQPKVRTLQEVWDILSHPETGFHKRSAEQQTKIVESVSKILAGSSTEAEDRKSIVAHLKGNNTLKAGLKAVVYDLLEEGVMQEYAQVIAEGKLMPFKALGNKGNLVEKFQEYYKDYPNLSKRSFIESVLNITTATGTVNIGKGEVALALLCGDVQPSTSAEGDMLVEGKTIEIKGSDARAISQKSGYRENSDKVILSALESKYDVKVPPLTGRFAQKLEHAFKQYVTKFPSNEDKAASFIGALDELLHSVYRDIKGIPQLIIEAKMNPEYIVEDGDSFALNSAALERDLAKILLEDYIGHHNFDKWFYFNSKNFDYLIVGREEVLNEASTDPISPIYLYVRDGTVRMTYGKFKLEEQVTKIGYHSSFKSSPTELIPSEMIKDAALAAKHQSKTGFLGTGLYYFGDPEVAKEYEDFMNTRPDREGANMFELNVGKLKMFTPQDAEEFVNDLRVTTINLYHLQGEELREEIQEAARDLTKYTHLEEQQLVLLLAKFAKDIKNASKAADKTQLANRLLAKYDGIDLSGTSKDNFGVGSVIFPKAIQKVASTANQSQPVQTTAPVLQKQLA